jgi:hypothetical protein
MMQEKFAEHEGARCCKAGALQRKMLRYARLSAGKTLAVIAPAA